MCIATVYIKSDGELEKVMDEVIRVDVDDGRLRLTNLFGEEKYIEGELKSVEFWEEHSIVVEPIR